MDAEDYRGHLVEVLQLSASPSQQRRYQEDVPYADVVAEVFCQWEDVYHPDAQGFLDAFDGEERARLAVFERISTSIAKHLPGCSLEEAQGRPEWAHLVHAARATLAALGEEIPEDSQPAYRTNTTLAERLRSGWSELDEMLPQRWYTGPVNLAICAALMILFPVFWVLYRCGISYRNRAVAALERQALELAVSNPAAAEDILRPVYERLREHEIASDALRFKMEPYGTFFAMDAGLLRRALYRIAYVGMDYESALELVREEYEEISTRESVLFMADCLEQLGRREEARAVLQENLELKDPDGEIAARLAELEAPS